MRNNFLGWMIALGVILGGSATAGTFGKVVAIGGSASDLALDEPRGVLYIANYTANRVEVMSLANLTVQTSINVASQPSGLALSPDGRYLVVTHYGNFVAPASPNNGLTVIDLTTNGKQTFVLGNPPLGVAFGLDNKALVVTSQEFILFDPITGTTQVLDTVAGVTAKTLPQPPATFPLTILGASMSTSQDGLVIYGLTDTLRFRYYVNTKTLQSVGYTASPPLGPRVVTVSADGSSWAGGWALFSSGGSLVGQFPNALGALNIGSLAMDNKRGLMYAQVPEAGSATTSAAPVLQIVDSDNLTVREKIQLSENLAGKSVIASDANTMYSISDSGVTVFPIGSLDQAHRVVASQEDVIFRGNFCDRRVASQQITIVNPGGGRTAFTLSTTTAGVTISPSSGITPATVRISVDPTAFQNQKGTVAALINVKSAQAVNLPTQIRVLINNREPDQRGTFFDIPGKLVDILPDPSRDRFYVLRQDKNQVLVFDGTNFSQVATLRTGNTPTQMAITFDKRYLLVGADNSQLLYVYDLETLQSLQPVAMPGGHYPRSVASSAKAILVANRVSGSVHTIDRVDLGTRQATQLPTLGVFANDVDQNTNLVASPNGSSIMAASANGNLWLYNANADTFTVSRKDGTSLSGAYAASSFDQFVVGGTLYNSSLVSVAKFDASTGTTSGFAFIDGSAIRTNAPDPASPGNIQRVDLTTATGIRTTRFAEAPLTGVTGFVFTRTLAPLYSRNSIVSLSVSGFTVLPWTYDDSVAPPRIDRVVSSADLAQGVAPGGLVTIVGANLSPVNAASREIPLPTALADSCLTVNGLPVPIVFVSPKQINAQLPFEAVGNVTLIVRTPGGVSDNFNLVILPTAPRVFLSGNAGDVDNLPTLVRNTNNLLVTDTNPVHRGDVVTIYLTGMGTVTPAAPAGQPAPTDPLATAIVQPDVTLGGVHLPLYFAGLSPGQVGVYQIDVSIPANTPTGLTIPLTINQGGQATTINIRVVN